MAEVRLRSIEKEFSGGVHAVKPCDLDISDGEFLVLVGPSGCGKSTLLRMIAGLEEPSGGTINIGSRDVTHVVIIGFERRDKEDVCTPARKPS